MKQPVTLPDDFDPNAAVRSRAMQVTRLEAARTRAEEVRRRIEQGGHTATVAMYRNDLAMAETNEREAIEAIERWDALFGLYQRRAA